jgi:hypothetical protein
MSLSPADLQQLRLESALALVDIGYAVVPIPEGRKAPVLDRWQDRASREPGQVQAWLREGQYGVLPPRGSRLLVVDFDRPDELSNFPALPPTLTVDTARGFHLYAALPEGSEESGVPRSFGGGEVRVAGSGLVVGPYSRHPSGSLYTPRNGLEVRELSADFLAALLRSHEAKSGAVMTARGPEDAGWSVGEPGRHDFLLSRARNLRGLGLSAERLREELRRLNTERCRPPKADKEVDLIVDWVTVNITDDPPSPIFRQSAEGDLRFYTAAEIETMTSAEPDWIIPGYVGREMLTELDGKVKRAGKTTLTLDMVAAILDGREWLGKPITAAKVIYLSEQQRGPFLAALKRAGLNQRGDELLVLFLHDFAGMAWPRVVAAVAAKATEIGAGLVIVDTISKLARIKEENSAADWVAALEPLQRIAHDGLAVLLCRHSRKGEAETGEAGRGSSAASGDVDIILDLRRPNGNVPGTRRVIEGMGRYSEDTPEKVVIDLTPDGYVLLGDDEAVALADAERILSDLLGGKFGQKESWSLDELIAESENVPGGPISRATAQRVLRHMRDRGVIAEYVDDGGKPRKGHPLRYALRGRESDSAQSNGHVGQNGIPAAQTAMPTIDPESIEGRYLRIIGEVAEQA